MAYAQPCDNQTSQRGNLHFIGQYEDKIKNEKSQCSICQAYEVLWEYIYSYIFTFLEKLFSHIIHVDSIKYLVFYTFFCLPSLKRAFFLNCCESAKHKY